MKGLLAVAGMWVLGYITYKHVLPMICCPVASSKGTNKNSSSSKKNTSEKATRIPRKQKKRLADAASSVVSIKHKRAS